MTPLHARRSRGGGLKLLATAGGGIAMGSASVPSLVRIVFPADVVL